jgi:phenylacetate-CoA ligase
MTFARRLPRFREAYRELETLAGRERWSRGDVETFQLARLNALWRRAVADVPYYRRLQGRHALPPRFASLAEFQASVPVLTKTPLRTDPAAFLAERPAPGTWRRTGGSTGTPMAVYWERDAHREVLRSRYRFYAAWGLDLFEREAYLWGHSSSFAPGLAGVVARLRQPLEDRLRNRVRLSAYHLGHDDLRAYLRRLAAFRPAMLYGYPRALYLLALEAEGMRFACDSLRLVTLTGEPSSPAVVESLERTFGAPAAVEYGSIECGVIASEWPDRTLRVRDDRVFVETVPGGDGRPHLVVTVLNNPSFPLVRYLIEDVTDVPLERPATGFTILNHVVGRDNDFVRTRSGRYLHAMRFDAFFKYQETGVRRFRVHQRADGSLSAAIEVERTPGAAEVAALQRRLSALVEGYRVDVDVTDTLPTSAAAKHRVVTSELGPRVPA